MKKIRNKIWPLAVGVTLTVLSQPSLLAATYNVLFNNIEQGPNGTANPKINVANGKATKTEDTKSLIDEKSDEEQPTATTTSAATSVAEVPSSKNEDSDKAKFPFRLGLMAAGVGYNGSSSSTVADSYTKRSGTDWGAGLGLSYFMLKDLGITAFGGINENMNYYGGELEFVPLRATLFGKKDFLDLGVVAGATTLGKKPEDEEFNQSSDRFAFAHLGARLGIQLSDRYGITTIARGNITGRNEAKLLTTEIGLSVRF